MNRIVLALVCLATSITVLAAEGFSSLEEQMTGKEFIAAGLDKLSEEELAALNAWIRGHSLGTLDAPAAAAAGAAAGSTDRRGLDREDEEEEDDSPIRSGIVGDFDGWDGQTVFKLENGMIWVQADKDKFYARDLENPIAEIKPGMFGTWYLSIEGYGSKCKVKRIQ
jgi:hypothetical protein